MPVTLRFQSTGAVPGDGAPIVMRGPSLTIGRGPENDVVLPDPDRLISKNHAALEDQGGGNVIVIDFSTNGTFLNYGKIPLGRVPTPLNDGDVLTMGPYEFVVAITPDVPQRSALDLSPVDDGPVSHGDAEAAPELMDLLDGSGVRRSDFLDDLMGEEPLRGHSQIVREDPIDELALPAMPGEEDPILGRIPEPMDEDAGAAMRYDGPSVSDGFRAKSVIPDDWDDDLMSPGGGKGGGRSRDPFSGGASIVPPPPPAAPRRQTDLPPDAFEGLIPGQSVVPKPPPARPRPPAPAPAPAGGGEEEDSPFAAPVASARIASVVPPPPKPASVPPPATPAPPPARPVAAPPAAPPVAPPPARPAAPPSAAAVDAARAFFRGAGQEDLTIPDAELAATMERLGGVMRVLIEGLREILLSRADFKGEFRVEKTRLGAGGNNPLKFALSPEHAVEAILRPRAKGYMDAGSAVGEALKDIKAHEVAMVTGMEAAIKDVLARLNPSLLEEKAAGGGLSMLSNRKAKLWDEYEKLYGTLAEQAEHDFHEFFARAFSKAYQEQLQRLK
jgi:type VI secretion system FHA domain protein